MIISRRALLERSAIVAAGAALFAALPSGFSLWSPALAQTPVSNEELMKPGPLEEKVMGSADAPVTMIEYASMTCSHCADFAVNTFPQLKARYIDTGKVRYILREFPLDPLAAGGFMLARCAGEGKGGSEPYFSFVETLFKEQKNWAFVQNPIPPLLALAKQHAGLNEQSFERCLSDQKVLDGIEETRKRAQTFGVNSTPTFFINGKIVRGAMSMEEIDRQVQPYLKAS